METVKYFISNPSMKLHLFPYHDEDCIIHATFHVIVFHVDLLNTLGTPPVLKMAFSEFAAICLPDFPSVTLMTSAHRQKDTFYG